MKEITVSDLQKIQSMGGILESALTKQATGDKPSQFDEAPAEEETNELEEGKTPEVKEQEEQPAPQEAVPQEAIPQEAAPSNDAESIGARAAQNFIGAEVMQAAVSGDAMAQDLIARTAGQVAGAVTESVLRSSGAQAAPAEAPVPQEEAMTEQPVEGQEEYAAVPAQPEAATTPEEDIANEIVPQEQPVQQPAANTNVVGNVSANAIPAAGPAAEGAEQPAAEGGEKVDVNDVKKLIELARAGKI